MSLTEFWHFLSKKLFKGFLATFVLAVFWTACSSPVREKNLSFMRLQDSNQDQLQLGKLNPLGELEECHSPYLESGKKTILIEHPKFFNAKNSQNLLRLWKKLKQNAPPAYLLSQEKISTEKEAQKQGSECQALAVLWEDKNNLKVYYPKSLRIPLQALFLQNPCPLGYPGERQYILYETLEALHDLLKGAYKSARIHMENAESIHQECLLKEESQLPKLQLPPSK